MTSEKMDEVCGWVEKYLDRNNARGEVYPYGFGLPVIEIAISWGDWKHDHMRVKWLMKEAGAMLVGTEVTEENGSDCYSAIHRFVVGDNIMQGVS